MNYYSGIRFDDFIICSQSIADSDLDLLQKAEVDFISATDDSPKLCIGWDRNHYILCEWTEYIVIGTNKSPITIDDFSEIGKYYKNNSGNIFIKNFVGYIKFKNQTFKVISSKINFEDLHSLIESIDHRIRQTVSLSFSEHGVTDANFEKNKERYNYFYAYMKLYNSLKRNKIIPYIKRVMKSSNRHFEKRSRTVSINMASQLSEDSLIDLFSGNSRFIDGDNNRCVLNLKNVFPIEINEYYNDISHDTNENRFVKFFIKRCIFLLTKFCDELKKYSPKNKMLIKEIISYREELNAIIRNYFFRNISDVPIINYSSTILTRQFGYKQIYEEYINLKQTPINSAFTSKDLMELYHNKSVDKLYEYICLFRLVDLLEEIYKTIPEEKVKIDTQSLPYTVGILESADAIEFKFKETDSFPKSSLLFQYSFNFNNGGTFSVEFKPDFTWKIERKNGEYIYYLFDSKFSLSKAGGTQSKDIAKMHAYCDGITVANGAFVLYPGAESILFKKPNSVSLFEGVGAFPINFDRDKSGALSNFLYSILSNG